MGAADGSKTPIRLFYSYSHLDEELRKKLEDHLAALRWSGMIAEWHDRNIDVGDEWAKEIDRNLSSADIILLLVSASFIASAYCWSVEMKKALERHETGEAKLIPVILRPCSWHITPFAKLQAAPTDAKPVTSWSDQDAALFDVARKIERAVTDLQKQRRLAAQRKVEEERQRAEADAQGKAEEQRQRAEAQRTAEEQHQSDMKSAVGDLLGEASRQEPRATGAENFGPPRATGRMQSRSHPNLRLITAGALLCGYLASFVLFFFSAGPFIDGNKLLPIIFLFVSLIIGLIISVTLVTKMAFKSITSPEERWRLRNRQVAIYCLPVAAIFFYISVWGQPDIRPMYFAISALFGLTAAAAWWRIKNFRFRNSAVGPTGKTPLRTTSCLKIAYHKQRIVT